MSHFRFHILISIAALMLTSCFSSKNNQLDAKQTVTVDSVPQNADIIYNGEFIGTTPMELHLATCIVHQVILKKDGFKDQKGYFNPTCRDNEMKFLKLGIAQELGYYYELTPNRLLVELEWDLLPSTKGIAPFSSMGSLTNKADKMLESGVVSNEEYGIIINQIVDFFSAY
tara:strand:+ start:226 stop:738 length:513 start_codon:yes stop_codon:yes gene_type:complete